MIAENSTLNFYSNLWLNLQLLKYPNYFAKPVLLKGCNLLMFSSRVSLMHWKHYFSHSFPIPHPHLIQPIALALLHYSFTCPRTFPLRCCFLTQGTSFLTVYICTLIFTVRPGEYLIAFLSNNKPQRKKNEMIEMHNFLTSYDYNRFPKGQCLVWSSPDLCSLSRIAPIIWSIWLLTTLQFYCFC